MKLRLMFSLLLGASLVAGAQGYHDGVDNYNANRKDIAKEILTNTLNDPSTDKAVSLYYLGNIAFDEGNITTAKANYEKGMQANPEYAYNYIGLGKVALKEGDKSGAKKLFDQALKTDKKNTELIANVARAYWNVDPVVYAKEIEKYIKEAFKKSKNTEPAVYMLQGDMVAAENPGEAAGLYEMAINMDKQNGNVNREAYVKYAHVYDVHNRPLVIEKLEELNQLEPTSGLAQRELAEQYYNNRQYGKAWKSYEKYVQNPNHFQKDELRYAGLLTSAGEYDQSIEWANKILKEDPTAYTMYRILMLNYSNLKNDSLTVVNAEKLFNYPGAEPVFNDYKVYSKALNNLKRSSDAITVLNKALTVFNGDEEKTLELYTLVSESYQKAGNEDKAIEYRLLYLNSGKATYQDYYGMYQSYFSKLQKAIKETGVESAEATTALTEAAKYIDLAISKAPNFATPYYRKAVLYYVGNGNKPNQACLDAINKALEILDASDEATQKKNKNYYQACYTMIGDHYLVEGNKEQAKAYYEKARPYASNPAALDERIKSLEAAAEE